MYEDCALLTWTNTALLKLNIYFFHTIKALIDRKGWNNNIFDFNFSVYQSLKTT